MMPNMKITLPILLLLVLLFGAALLFAYFIFIHNAGKEVITAEKRTFVESVYASGYVDCENRATVSSEVSGNIEKIFVEVGDDVKTGQILARIFNETLKNELNEVSERKRLVQNRLKAGSNYRKAYENDIRIRLTSLEKVRKTHSRKEELFAKGIISREEMEDSEKTFEIAESQYDRSRELYGDALDSLLSELKTLSAREGAITKELEKYTIGSPIDGQVLRKFVETGDYINTMSEQNKLFSVGDPRSLEAVLLVDEEYIPLVKIGAKILITTDAYPDKVFKARVSSMEKESDRKTRTVEVKGDVELPSDIPICSNVEANIIHSEREAIAIPEQALQNGIIKIVQNGKIVEKSVKTGISQGGFIEILEGLEEGQEIEIR